VFFGTLYPLALEALTGGKISVGPPFFDMTFGPLMLALLVVMPFGPFLAWKRGDLGGVTQRLGAAIAVAVLVTIACWWVKTGGPALAPLGIGLAAFVMLGALSEFSERIRLFREPPGASLRRLSGLPRSAIGTTLAHFGMGVTLLGIVGASAWQTETVAAMRAGETVAFGRYEARLEGSTDRQGPNYTDKVAHLVILEDGAPVAKIESAKRFYPARQMPTTEAGIHTFWLDQVYVSRGDDQPDGAVVVRLYDKPLITLVWLGCVVMAVGGAFSLSDRRLRVGAPKPARRAAKLQAAE
jgi:cytochrome c-type biogenesis protein CcmF